MKGRTVVVVPHRLSTVSHMDRILVLDQGKIIEDASHQHLLLKKWPLCSPVEHAGRWLPAR